MATVLVEQVVADITGKTLARLYPGTSIPQVHIEGVNLAKDGRNFAA